MRILTISIIPYTLAACALLAGAIVSCQAPPGAGATSAQPCDSAPPDQEVPPTQMDCAMNPMLRSGVPHNGEPKNGISVDSLRANQGLIRFLANNPLQALSELTSAAPGGKSVLRSLASDDGIALTKYVVMCALDPCQKVTVHDANDDPLHVQAMTFSGELGLCAGNAPYGDWYSGNPTEACLQAVSACVLARVNAQHKKVVISIRDPYSIIDVADKVPVETEYREGGGTPIPSFETCPSSGPMSLPGADCGYSPQFVGRCASGSKVTLQGFDPGVTVRVCQGLYGCEATPTNRWYASPLECAPNVTSCTASAITFACPVQVHGQPGYYSVMTKPPSGASAGNVSATCDIAGPCEYPAQERDVFKVPEGAFYGTIFEPFSLLPSASPLNNSCPPRGKPDILSGHQFACFSDAMTSGIAALSDRYCALPSPTCFFNTPQLCQASACGTLTAGVPDPLFTACHGTTPDSTSLTYETMTVYLNHPCDPFADLASCQCANQDAFKMLWTPNFSWKFSGKSK
jgi:hypothetical protein